MNLCITTDCSRPIENKLRQLCSSCYRRWRRDEDPSKPRCKYNKCERPIEVSTTEWCHLHRRRVERSPDGNPDGVGRGKPGFKRNGQNSTGRYITKNGYVKIRLPEVVGKDGWVLEHRYVMEQKLGRKLLPGENVHHINGDRTCNDPDNLELWVINQPQGQRLEDLLRWAHEIIERYGDSD